MGRFWAIKSLDDLIISLYPMMLHQSIINFKPSFPGQSFSSAGWGSRSSRPRMDQQSVCVCCTSAAKKYTRQFSLIRINHTNEGNTVMSGERSLSGGSSVGWCAGSSWSLPHEPWRAVAAPGPEEASWAGCSWKTLEIKKIINNYPRTNTKSTHIYISPHTLHALYKFLTPSMHSTFYMYYINCILSVHYMNSYMNEYHSFYNIPNVL